MYSIRTEISHESGPGGNRVKVIIEDSFSTEPLNTYVRAGQAGNKIGAALGAIKPEVIRRLVRSSGSFH
jgi:hypothetical protein